MTFGDRIVGAMRLDPNTFEDIERDTTAMGQAIGVVALAAISAGIGNIWYGGFRGIVGRIIASLIGYVLWTVLVWLVGTKLMPDPETKADLPETFRVIAFAAAPGVLGFITIIPLLGWLLMFLLWLWMIAAMVVAVRQVLDYRDTVKAVVVVAIGFVIQWVVSAAIAAMLIGGAMLGALFGAR